MNRLDILKAGDMAAKHTMHAHHQLPPPAHGEQTPANAPSIGHRGQPPPQEPKAHGERKNGFQNRGVHATESQTYYRGYSDTASAPAHRVVSPQQQFVYHQQQIDTSQQQIVLPQQQVSTAAAARADSVTDTIPHEPWLSREAHRAHQKAQLLHGLCAHLAYLKGRAIGIAETYRNLGLLFHSYPAHIVFLTAIIPEIRTFARKNFMVAFDGRCPLPDMMYVIGTLDSAVRGADEKLKKQWLMDSEVQRVKAGLDLAARQVGEAMPKLEMLRDAVEVLCRMRTIVWLEGKKVWERTEASRRRIRSYQTWAHALPAMCWEEFADVDNLDASKGRVMAL